MRLVANTEGIVHQYDMFKIQVFNKDEDLVDESFFETANDAKEFAKQNFPNLPFNLFRVEHFKRTTRI